MPDLSTEWVAFFCCLVHTYCSDIFGQNTCSAVWKASLLQVGLGVHMAFLLLGRYRACEVNRHILQVGQEVQGNHSGVMKWDLSPVACHLSKWVLDWHFLESTCLDDTSFTFSSTTPESDLELTSAALQLPMIQTVVTSQPIRTLRPLSSANTCKEFRRVFGARPQIENFCLASFRKDWFPHVGHPVGKQHYL